MRLIIIIYLVVTLLPFLYCCFVGCFCFCTHATHTHTRWKWCNNNKIFQIFQHTSSHVESGRKLCHITFKYTYSLYWYYYYIVYFTYICVVGRRRLLLKTDELLRLYQHHHHIFYLSLSTYLSLPLQHFILKVSL